MLYFNLLVLLVLHFTYCNGVHRHASLSSCFITEKTGKYPGKCANIDGMCYLLVRNRSGVDWMEQEKMCQSLWGHLPIFQTGNEYKGFQKAKSQWGLKVFPIGLKFDHNMYSKSGGGYLKGWKWVDGSEVKFSAWGDQRPRRNRNTSVVYETGRWFDAVNAKHNFLSHFACQRKCSSVNCELSPWSSWSICSSRSHSHKGTKKRSKYIIKPATGSGSCPTKSSIVEEEKCSLNVHDNENCILSKWSAWSSCSRSCDTGKQTRSRHVLKPATGAGACPSKAEMMETKMCNNGQCQDKYRCELGEWEEWSYCSKSCGTGTQIRTRKISVYRFPIQCPHFSETKYCNGNECNMIFN